MKSVVNLAVLTTTILALPVNAKVIYGEDGRKEVFEASEARQKLARSTAVMMGIEHIKESTTVGAIDLTQDSFEEWLRAQSGSENPDKELLSRFKKVVDLDMSIELTFCAEERFTEQPNPGMCSGFLIAPDLLVTAGHCAEITDACEAYKWVFDFKVNQESGASGLNVPNENVYGCKRIVTNSLNMHLGTDYAVFQLERKVTGRDSLEINLTGTLADDAQLVVIGNPSGLPTKITEGGKVRTNAEANFFTAVLDTYQGNSGSAVFNAETNKIEGILVRGENDFNFNDEKKCVESNHCKEDECRGEDVSRITSIPELALMELINSSAVSGDTEMLEKIFAYKFYADFYLKDGQSALIKAAAAGTNASLVLLLANGADVNLSDAEGNTALHHLAKILTPENAVALTTLTVAGAKLDVKNNAGQTPLMIAKSLENVEGEKLFLQAGAME